MCNFGERAGATSGAKRTRHLTRIIMDAYILEWLNLLGRWVHFITGIAWIGSSFYFIWLDDHLQVPRDASDDEKGVGGEVWSVHGGEWSTPPASSLSR